jgi:hypothetical protein
MRFRSLFNWLKFGQSRRARATRMRRPSVRPTRRPQLETLEDRSIPAVITDPVGDFLPTYTGVQDAGLDVVAHEVIVLEDRMIFFGRMDGPIAPTQLINGLYLFGVDRGQGTPRFLNGTPVIGPNVVWDSLVRINPDGTGRFNNLLTGVVTPLNPADISISGNELTASVPLSLMQPAATKPPQEWTYNLWPRDGLTPGQNQNVSDLAPDDGNSPVHPLAPARVESVVVNDGAAQRSMIKSVTVTFDAVVTLDSGAFELSRADDTLVDLSIATSTVDGRTQAVLTFAGADVIDGSLAEGSYTLTIHGDLIHDTYGRSLDADADGVAGGDRTDAFFRLYGDSDGDGDVDGLDRDLFRSAFHTSAGDAAYLWYFDFNGDGVVDGHDNGPFNRRFGQI